MKQAALLHESPIPPLQDRSRRTVTALTRGALRLLRSTEFEALTIGGIVEAANSSVGSFYARFPSKEDFLFHLVEHVLKEDVVPGAQRQMAPERFVGAGVEPRMRAALDYVAQVFVRHRKIIRPLTLQMHTSADHRFKEAARFFNEPLHDAFYALMADAPELATITDFRRKLDDVLLWSGASLRQVFVLRDPPAEREAQQAVSRLARCMANYLTLA